MLADGKPRQVCRRESQGLEGRSKHSLHCDHQRLDIIFLSIDTHTSPSGILSIAAMGTKQSMPRCSGAFCRAKICLEAQKIVCFECARYGSPKGTGMIETR